jgi:choline dehydrogenase-like flavoprotein
MAGAGLGTTADVTAAGGGRVGPDWTAREIRTVEALCDTFVAGGADRTAALLLQALQRAADPAQVSQLRIVLRAMESPAANAALGAGFRRFSEMDRPRREAYLRSWASSRIPQRRSAFSSLRKLATFLAYADPGLPGLPGLPGTPNPRHAAIGYRPQWPPLAAAPTTIVPFALPFASGAPDDPLTLEADVVIVGSGAGGGVSAAALARAGRSVVVLEAGPFVDEASMPGDELDAFARLYLNHGLLATWDGAATLLAGSGVGGGTLVNWMTTIAAPASVREEWRRSDGLDGLGDAEEWGADVAALEAELQVSDATFIPPKDELILRGAAALGWEAGPIRRNSAGCDDCGSCGFGCRRGAKRSGIQGHLAEAFSAGARIVPRVRVTRVLLEGGRAVGAEGLAVVPDPTTGEPIDDANAPGGVRVRRLRVLARQVVLAAGALRTPAILQGSGLEHPAIGRHLRIHPVSGVITRMPTPVDLWLGTMQAAKSLQFIDSVPGRAGYVIESAPGHPGLVALAVPWEGATEHAALMSDVRHLGAVLAVTRDGGEGRTTLTKAGRVRIDYALDDTGIATLRHALVSTARIARAGGAVDIMAAGTRPAWFRGAADAGEGAFDAYLQRLAAFDFSPNRGTVFSAHQMGSARMGADPRGHVCDPAGRVRVGERNDAVVRGLYVSDTSLFPTGLGVNPMLTAMALARRVSRTVLSEA